MPLKREGCNAMISLGRFCIAWTHILRYDGYLNANLSFRPIVDISTLMGTSSSVKVRREYSISLPIKENGSARQLDNSQWTDAVVVIMVAVDIIVMTVVEAVVGMVMAVMDASPGGDEPCGGRGCWSPVVMEMNLMWCVCVRCAIM